MNICFFITSWPKSISTGIHPFHWVTEEPIPLNHLRDPGSFPWIIQEPRMFPFGRSAIFWLWITSLKLADEHRDSRRIMLEHLEVSLHVLLFELSLMDPPKYRGVYYRKKNRKWILVDISISSPNCFSHIRKWKSIVYLFVFVFFFIQKKLGTYSLSDSTLDYEYTQSQ